MGHAYIHDSTPDILVFIWNFRARFSSFQSLPSSYTNGMVWPELAFTRESLSFERPWVAGNWGVPAPQAHQQHVHDTLELIWNLRPMVLLLSGRRLVLKDTTVVILPPFMPHIAEPFHKNSREILGCHVGLLEPALQTTPMQWPLKAGPLSTEHTALVLPLLNFMVKQSRESPGANTSPDLRLVAQGILAMLRSLGYAAPMRRLKNFRPVRRALEVLYARYTDPDLNMEALARAANFSSAQFRRVFQKVMGESPNAYLARHRLEQARHLLGHDVLTVTAVARRVGFKSPSSFYKAYQKAYGISPREG